MAVIKQTMDVFALLSALFICLLATTGVEAKSAPKFPDLRGCECPTFVAGTSNNYKCFVTSPDPQLVADPQIFNNDDWKGLPGTASGQGSVLCQGLRTCLAGKKLVNCAECDAVSQQEASNHPNMVACPPRRRELEARATFPDLRGCDCPGLTTNNHKGWQCFITPPAFANVAPDSWKDAPSTAVCTVHSTDGISQSQEYICGGTFNNPDCNVCAQSGHNSALCVGTRTCYGSKGHNVVCEGCPDVEFEDMGPNGGPPMQKCP
ncbi:MAG: hypothetical protein Q9227_001014 [Pyrenula ochraceoflavens]